MISINVKKKIILKVRYGKRPREAGICCQQRTNTSFFVEYIYFRIFPRCYLKAKEKTKKKKKKAIQSNQKLLLFNV
jgi:hypothetical protein